MGIHIKHKNEKIKFLFKLIVDIICIACLTGTLLYLCETQNVLYQSHKNLSASKAIFLFAVFMFITQRVRLFNWQSLLATILYLPIGYAYRMRYATSPTLFERDKVVVLIVWIALMIAVDMAVYKKVNPLQKFHVWSLTVFALMTITMSFYRIDRTYPAILVLFFLFYLIPLNSRGWERVINQFCGAWLVTFFIILYRSLKNNPELDVIEGAGRWYGDFLNIGYFGLFMACVVVVILFKLYQTKKNWGRMNIPYILCFLCLIPILWTVFRVSTITMYIGIGCIFFMGFILLMKNCSGKKVIFRFAASSIVISLLFIVGYIILRELANTDAEYWEAIMIGENVLLKPIANLIHRAHYMFDEPRTFANSGIFEPDSIINYLDLFTSGRLSIIKVFSEHFNFVGNSSDGYQVGTYFAYSAHNAYIQVIYEYGYIGGGFFIIWLLYSTVTGVYQYVKSQKVTHVLICVWMAMTLGVLLGEVVNLYTPTIFMTLLITYPVMVKPEDTATEQ